MALTERVALCNRLLDDIAAIEKSRQRVARRHFAQHAILHDQIEILALQTEHALFELGELHLRFIGEPDDVEESAEELTFGLGERTSVGGDDTDARSGESNRERAARFGRLSVDEAEWLLQQRR